MVRRGKRTGKQKEAQTNPKRFLLTFFGTFFALFILLHLLDLSALTSFLASAQAKALNAAGIDAVADGSMLYAGGILFLFVSDCTGLVMVILLAALLYSTNIPGQERRKALLVFSPLLLLFNFARLFATILAGVAFPEILDAIHIALWFVDSGVVLLAWSHAIGCRKAF